MTTPPDNTPPPENLVGAPRGRLYSDEELDRNRNGLAIFLLLATVGIVALSVIGDLDLFATLGLVALVAVFAVPMWWLFAGRGARRFDDSGPAVHPQDYGRTWL